MLTRSRDDVDAGEIDHVQIDDIEVVVAGGDAAEARELTEEAFDQTSGLIGRAVQRTLSRRMPVRMRRRDQVPAERPSMAVVRPTLVGTVGDELWLAGLRAELFEQMPAAGRIAGLARRQGHDQRQPVVVHDGVQLGRQAPARAADRLAPFSQRAAPS